MLRRKHGLGMAMAMATATRSFCYAVRFVYDAENEVPLFYRNRMGKYFYEESYLARFRKEYESHLPDEVRERQELADGRYDDPLVCMLAIAAIGKMPENRELAACTIPRPFFERHAYRVRRWLGEQFWYHDVVLRRRQLRHTLLVEALAKGEVRRSRYVRLVQALETAVIKHAVEIDLRETEGRRYVIFLSRDKMQGLGKRDAISRELAKVGVCVDGLELRLWRPEDRPPPRGHFPFFRKTLQRQIEETKKQMDERLQMTHCRTAPLGEEEPVYDRNMYLDPRRLPTVMKDYRSSNFDTESMELEMEAEERRKRGETDLVEVKELVPIITDEGFVIGTRLARKWKSKAAAGPVSNKQLVVPGGRKKPPRFNGL